MRQDTACTELLWHTSFTILIFVAFFFKTICHLRAARFSVEMSRREVGPDLPRMNSSCQCCSLPKTHLAVLPKDRARPGLDHELEHFGNAGWPPGVS